MHGMGFIRGDMIRDLAALAKVPLLPWDCWGNILDKDITGLDLLDKVAEVTQPATTAYKRDHGVKPASTPQGTRDHNELGRHE